MKSIHRLIDRFKEWYRYPQPGLLRRQLLGQHTDVVDYEFTATRLASEESARYMLENMRAIPNFACDYDLHEWVVTTQLDPRLDLGYVLEFGVATGRTLNHFARLMPHKTIYGFDSFQGLPEDWTSRMRKGFFARDNLPTVRKNCVLMVGWFEQGLADWQYNHQNHTPIQFLHIDCDLYSSAHTVLHELRRRIVPGTVIVFDEYINYPGWQQDEFRAWQEFVDTYNISYEYIGRVSSHQQVAVRVTSVFDLGV